MAPKVGPWPKTRSRSPQLERALGLDISRSSGSWAAMRPGAPERRQRARGKFPSLDTPEERDAALAAVRAGRYADSSQGSVESHRRFIVKALLKWQLTPYPPTIDKVEMVAAALKVGIYRSASSYLGQYRADSERAGYDLGDPIRRAFKDMTRSCTRGLGPGAKSMALPMHRLAELPKARQPWAAGGPINPRHTIIVGS